MSDNEQKVKGRNYDKLLADNGNGPHPVGQKQPNVWSLYDTLGNLNQWTADWYDEKYYELREGEDPTGPASGTERVARGGTWKRGPGDITATRRFYSDADNQTDDIGVRCAGK